MKKPPFGGWGNGPNTETNINGAKIETYLYDRDFF